jgi:chemotaxis protein methyltransferase CheR
MGAASAPGRAAPRRAGAPQLARALAGGRRLAEHLREFAFGDEDFEELRRLVKRTTGIHLSEQKRELVYGRLARRLRALGLDSFRAYRELLAREPAELVPLTNAITTNLTAFFREPHHFEYLCERVRELASRGATSQRRLRIWSAGCSSGEEPYSIAMSLLERVPDIARWDLRILATDLDSDVLARARTALYPAERLHGVGAKRLARFFVAHDSSRGPAYRLRPELTALVTFKQLNLVHPLPMKGPLDAIFCRNTVIYFDKETQRELFARIARVQRPGDLLFLGHSESLFKISEDYALIGRTVYRRG